MTNTNNRNFTLSLDRSFHELLMSLAKNEDTEFGGNVKLYIKNRTSGVMTMGLITKGTFNNVNFPRGIVDWHTHPIRCQNVDKCAIGFPSPGDMVNTIIGSSIGNLAHLVYSRDGVYILQVHESIRTLLVNQTNLLGSFTDKVNRQFECLFLKFKQDSLLFPDGIPTSLYKQWKREWYTVSKLTFNVTLVSYKHNKLPSFSVNRKCIVSQIT